jgi:succinate dehydrogenase / fumarate reductase membrane anchor subunit
MAIKSPLGRAKGKGSAHDGVHHWLMQRITAVALIPLSIWFVVSFVCLSTASYEDAVAFFKSPLNAVLIAGLIVSALWHGALGLQVIIEDYVAKKPKKIALLVFIKLFLFALGLSSLLSIAKLNFG